LKPYCPLQALGWEMLKQLEDENAFYIHHAVLLTENNTQTILMISKRYFTFESDMPAVYREIYIK
jgi:hypothetical protein